MEYAFTAMFPSKSGTKAINIIFTPAAVVSNKSPWLQKAELGATYCNPASHGEGRFVADQEWLDRLFRNVKSSITASFIFSFRKAVAKNLALPSGSSPAEKLKAGEGIRHQSGQGESGG